MTDPIPGKVSVSGMPVTAGIAIELELLSWFDFRRCDKHHEQRQLAEERVYLDTGCSPSWREVKAGLKA